jgi:YVTN family beta-propeller protein
MPRKSAQRESGKHTTRTRATDRWGQWGRISVLGVIAALGLLGLGMAPAQAAPFAYISNFSDDTVSVLDTATNGVVATVPVGRIPTAWSQFIGAQTAR